MLLDCARYTKKGRGSIQALVAPTLQVDEEFILLDRWLKGEPTTDKTQQVYIDVAGVRNPATKARNVRYRLAAGAGWKASFTIAWDVTIVSRVTANLTAPPVANRPRMGLPEQFWNAAVELV